MFKSKLLSLAIIFVIFKQHTAYAYDTYHKTNQEIVTQREKWFNHLNTQIIAGFPTKGSQEANLDRQISWEKQHHVSKARKELAIKDKDQSTAHIRQEFRQAALPNFATNITDKQFTQAFESLEKISQNAIIAYDSNKNRLRSYDFILKDKFLRGRPYQVMDKNGNYIQDYETQTHSINKQGQKIPHSSYPSGHTSNGFGQAVVMALAFPERGSEVFSRALQYGESRVIVGAHFATDTITSRLSRYYYMAQLLNNDVTARGVATLAQQARQPFEQACTSKLQECLQKLPESVHNEHQANNYQIGYYATLKNNNANPIITPDKIPNDAAALLRLRFGYLDNHAHRQILASTAYPANSLAQIGNINNTNHQWGLINLPSAYKGIKYLYQDIQTKPADEFLDFANFSKNDVWENDISGVGRLTINHNGQLTLLGNNTFAGATVKNGQLIFFGDSHLTADSHIKNKAIMNISGNFQSKVVIYDSGRLNLDNHYKNISIKDIELVSKDSQIHFSDNEHKNKNFIHIKNISGNGKIIINNNKNTHIENVTGGHTFYIKPNKNPVTISSLKGTHYILAPKTLSTNKKEQNLIKTEDMNGELYLINENDEKIDAIEQGAYAYQLIFLPEKIWKISQLSNKNQAFASLATKTALNSFSGIPYVLYHQMSSIPHYAKNHHVWIQHQNHKHSISHDYVNFRLNNYQTSLGLDYHINKSHIGLYATLNNGKINHHFNGHNNIKGSGMGIYFNHKNSNHTQFLIQGAWQNNKQQIYTKQIDNTDINANLKNSLLGIMLQAKKEYQINYKKIQPFFNIIHIITNSKPMSYHQLPDLKINFKNSKMTTIDLGGEMTFQGKRINPYIKFGISHHKNQQNIFIEDTKNQETSTWQSNISGLGIFGTVAAHSQINDKLNITGEISHQHSKAVDTPIQAKLTVSYHF